MDIRKAYRYRIYPTPGQESRLIAWEASLRFLWNLANEQRLQGLSRSKGERRYYTAFDQINQLTELRHELPWLAEVPVAASQQLLVALDRAWQRCFQGTARAPRFKSKGKSFRGLLEPSPNRFRLSASSIRFPKLGNIRAIIHRPHEGNPKTCTLRRDGGQWYAIIVCQVSIPDPNLRMSPVVALDRGVSYTLADSNGRLTPNPRFYNRALKRLARAQRTVSRRNKGSKNREKAKAHVVRLHAKVRRQRAHFLHVESARYAKSHGVVVIEKLNISGMVRFNRGLSRGIFDAGWYRFAEMLQYKMEWSGGTLIEVPPAYSSTTCATCGHVDTASRKGELFCCCACGNSDHADLNAAKALKARANRSGLMPVEGKPVGPRRSRKARGSLRAPSRAKPLCESVTAVADYQHASVVSNTLVRENEGK